LRYEFQIAARYLLSRHKTRSISVTTVFTGLGVAIGVAALCVVISVMNGFEANLRQRVLHLTPPVEVTSISGPIADYDALAQRIDHVPGVSGAVPFLNSQAMLGSRYGLSGVLVRAIQPDSPVALSQLKKSLRLISGSIESLRTGHSSSATVNHGGPETIGGLLIGGALALKLKVGAGDRLKIVSPILSADREQLHVRVGEVIVGGLFSSGVSFVDRNLIIMALSSAQGFFGREQKADGIQVYLDDLSQTERVTRQLQTELSYPYLVRNWTQINEAYAAGFAMLKLVYSLVLMVLIGVAAFNLIATLIMTGMERRKDVAILMTMGAPARATRLIFFSNAMLLGGIGTLSGLLLALITCWALGRYHFIHIPEEIYGTSTIPVVVAPLEFLLVAVAAISLCMVASIYPARRTSRRLPIEVMRRE
jgi:lipoprotein-releasing system permease protein